MTYGEKKEKGYWAKNVEPLHDLFNTIFNRHLLLKKKSMYNLLTNKSRQKKKKKT